MTRRLRAIRWRRRLRLALDLTLAAIAMLVTLAVLWGALVELPG